MVITSEQTIDVRPTKRLIPENLNHGGNKLFHEASSVADLAELLYSFEKIREWQGQALRSSRSHRTMRSSDDTPILFELHRWSIDQKPYYKTELIKAIREFPQMATDVRKVSKFMARKEFGETVVLYRALSDSYSLRPFDSMTNTLRCLREFKDGGRQYYVKMVVPIGNIFTWHGANPALGPFSGRDDEWILDECSVQNATLVGIYDFNGEKVPEAIAQEFRRVNPNINDSKGPDPIQPDIPYYQMGLDDLLQNISQSEDVEDRINKLGEKYGIDTWHYSDIHRAIVEEAVRAGNFVPYHVIKDHALYSEYLFDLMISKLKKDLAENRFKESMEFVRTKLGENIPDKSLFERYRPKREWYLHPETSEGIHGEGHDGRVMVLQEILARLLISMGIELDQEALRWAVSVHDKRRINQFEDHGHGERAAEWMANDEIRKLIPEKSFVTTQEIVKLHDYPDRVIPEMSAECAVFKDADALDRYRLGTDGDLKVEMLRNSISRSILGEIARKLVIRSHYRQYEFMKPAWEAALNASFDLGIITDHAQNR